MIDKILPLFAFILIIGCTAEKPELPESLDYLPGKGFALVKINNFSAFASDLKNNHFLNAWDGSTLYKKVSGAVAPLQYIQSNGQALLAFYRTGQDSMAYVLVAPYTPNIFKPDEAANYSRETLTFKDRELEQYTFGDKRLYSIQKGNQFLLSPSDSLLKIAETIPSGFGKDQELNKLYTTANPDRNASFFLNLVSGTNALSRLFQPDALPGLSSFTDWVALDFGSQQDYLSLNGIALPSDSLPNFVDLFRDMAPLPLQTPSFAPETAQAVIAYALDDYARYSSNRQHFYGEVSPTDTLLQTVEELGYIFDRSGRSVMLQAYGSQSITAYLNRLASGSFNYQDHEIIGLEPNTFLLDAFHPLTGDFQANFYTVLENSLIFSEDQATLTHLIDDYMLGNTFDKTPVYKAAGGSLADASNILLVATQKGMGQLLESDLEQSVYEAFKEADLSEYSLSAQLVAEESFFHTSLMLKRLGAISNNPGAVPWYSVELDGPLATDPQFVINHRTHKKEVVVQDENNNLYLISTEGKVLWKKPLGGRIQGTISQVDLYNNGRLQLAFTTDSQFIILDRNGKEVAPFNMTFPGGNLNPLAVFDYENNKQYRFVVTQADKVHMYNNQGKIVHGFTYTKADSPILPSPQHIRFGNKDYLVFRLEDGELKILNRVGHSRIKVNEKIDFSGNGVFPYKNHFALTDKHGTLFLIDDKGKVTKTAYDLDQDHGMDATSKSLAFMNENILTIKGNAVPLDYGLYTAPKIFYLYDTIYVSVTDLQSHRTFLFDSSGQPIAGFPVLGSSPADLTDMDNDRQLELVVKGQDDSLIVYRLK